MNMRLKIQETLRTMHEHAVLIFVIWPLAILLAPFMLALSACQALADGGGALLFALFRPLREWNDRTRRKVLVAQALRA